MKTCMYLPDINVWLALTFEAHMHHRIAKDWFETTKNENNAFCRMTQQGFLRLATNPAVFGDEAISLTKSWECYDKLIGDPRVIFVVESAGLDTFWREYSSRQSYCPKVWNDAYLAAFARSGNHCLITFDQGFKQYKELNCIVF